MIPIIIQADNNVMEKLNKITVHFKSSMIMMITHERYSTIYPPKLLFISKNDDQYNITIVMSYPHPLERRRGRDEQTNHNIKGATSP